MTTKTIFISLATIGITVLIGCCGKELVENTTPPVKEYIYVPVKDTITEKSNIAKIVALQHELTLTRDSLHAVRDSIGDELVVARYKLNRIEEYCKIAKKGNNIKYLRGWIMRALKD